MTFESWVQLMCSLAQELDVAHIPYCFEGDAALFVQGIDVPDMGRIEVSVQWDVFDHACTLWSQESLEERRKGATFATFQFSRDNKLVILGCVYNTVVTTDPYRIRVERVGATLWVKSWEYYVKTCAPDDPKVQQIKKFLLHKQQGLSAEHENAWNMNAYDAWINRFGVPTIAAEQIKHHPLAKLQSLARFMGDVRGKHIANLLGSHGSKAVALSLLGATVTVIDFSEQNATYGTELAQAAGVNVRYVVSDVLALPHDELVPIYDMVLMELGILHYFIDLAPLAQVVYRLLRMGGKLVLQDFHPVSTKLITSKGRKHKVTGNYFDSSIEETNVAFTKYVEDYGESRRVQLRKWTLGDIVTSFASAGLCVCVLEEEPNHKVDDMGIPKTFTLVAEKR